jgi:hypothetical protein
MILLGLGDRGLRGFWRPEFRRADFLAIICSASAGDHLVQPLLRSPA